MAKKKILLIFYLVVVLFLSFSLLLNRVLVEKRTVGEALPPSQVIVSNISPRSFTVSWFTEKKTTGSVIFSNLQTASDSRGAFTWSQVHWATVENLQPNQKYYFAIKSGGELFYKNLDGSWGKNGVAEEQKTPEEIRVATPCFRPNLIFGKVTDKEGQFIAEAIVFLEIPGKSTILSTLSNNKGEWAANLANLYQKDLSGFQTYNPQVDLVRISSKDEKGRTASSYQLIPYVFSPEDVTNPVILELTSLPPTEPPSPAPTPSWPTPTPSSFLEVKIKLL